jgi:hypothetical protein
MKLKTLSDETNNNLSKNNNDLLTNQNNFSINSNSNNRERLGSIEENLYLNDDTNNNMLSLYSSSSSSSSTVPNTATLLSSTLMTAKDESPPLKRANKTTICDDINMANYSSCDNQNRNSKIDESNLESSSLSIDYIEENKTIINGINVRAAKLSKLIEILIESFGKFQFAFIFFINFIIIN